MMEFQAMTDDELRQEMRRCGMPVLPITLTTRNLIIKKLQNFQIKPESSESNDTDFKVNQNGKSQESENNIEKAESDLYVVVYDPASESTPKMMRTVEQAASLAKSSPTCRFRCFRSFHEAESFSMSPQTSILETSNSVAREPDPLSKFPSVKPKDMNFFKSLFQENKLEEVCRLVLNNPKYIITSIDYPAIIHEGYRRNALHVAAHLDRPQIVEFILSILKDVYFISRFYSFEEALNGEAFDKSTRLLELMLNTPEKACFETPLHIAAKYGCFSIVSQLLREPLTNPKLKNRFDETAYITICSRYDKDDHQTVKEKIQKLFHNNYFVIISLEQTNFKAECVPGGQINFNNVAAIIGPTSQKKVFILIIV
ncbi:Ankyrin repeat and LEM domain-containing protein 2 [Thelohanellus kitauei]|uniref:Ankyrin repeat and LEM domain-containing protein 2 n=1 Tax=Thelohanellus kitauei TaxID=669202 RepID=A0A0C2N087_THEKT|nr:Ankyrin repeat and LEM domain-containing protein 2 [Thelohanellus kitauei]